METMGKRRSNPADLVQDSDYGISDRQLQAETL